MRHYFIIRFDGIPYEFSLETRKPDEGCALSIQEIHNRNTGNVLVFEHGNFPVLGNSRESTAFGADLKRAVLLPHIGDRLKADVRASLASIAAQIQAELDSRQSGCQTMAAALALQFMTIISRATAQLPRSEVWKITDAINHIEENYADAFTLEFFVSNCALNVSDFSRRFKEKAGCPLFEFIHRQRIRHACSLLKASDMPIIDVSFAVGYNNLSFFNRYFLRLIGVSPRAFRQSSR